MELAHVQVDPDNLNTASAAAADRLQRASEAHTQKINESGGYWLQVVKKKGVEQMERANEKGNQKITMEMETILTEKWNNIESNLFAKVNDKILQVFDSEMRGFKEAIIAFGENLQKMREFMEGIPPK